MVAQCISPSWSCSQVVSKPVWPIPLLCVQWKTPDVGQRNCPKYVDFHSKVKEFWEISASSWFYNKKFITMHDHMNVKLPEIKKTPLNTLYFLSEVCLCSDKKLSNVMLSSHLQSYLFSISYRNAYHRNYTVWRQNYINIYIKLY